MQWQVFVRHRRRKFAGLSAALFPVAHSLGEGIAARSAGTLDRPTLVIGGRCGGLRLFLRKMSGYLLREAGGSAASARANQPELLPGHPARSPAGADEHIVAVAPELTGGLACRQPRDFLGVMRGRKPQWDVSLKNETQT